MMGLGKEWIDKYLKKMVGMAEYVSMHDNDGCKITLVILHPSLSCMPA
jgi:hypothetical protein